jgi:predicted flavoprotein YhiN
MNSQKILLSGGSICNYTQLTTAERGLADLQERKAECVANDRLEFYV